MQTEYSQGNETAPFPNSDLVWRIACLSVVDDQQLRASTSWAAVVSQQITSLLKDGAHSGDLSSEIVQIGTAALQAFLQATVTGPALSWRPFELLLPDTLVSRYGISRSELQVSLRNELSRDGEAVYRLLPHVELFAFAISLLNHDQLKQTAHLLRWRIRVNCWHQRLLNENSPTLQDLIYKDLQALEHLKSSELLIERATIHLLHGLDSKARSDLQEATVQRGFEFALTGRLGKRTQYQDKELSQLVVLAKSAQGEGPEEEDLSDQEFEVPKSIMLNDDTLLENISFSQSKTATADVALDVDLPQSLAGLDASNQPYLQPLDCVILLATASSITNTSPQDGLTREQTLPYADRVIAGGSNNWQVYTEALHVRSRVEGYKSRTAERGVLQLQALVDQVIADVDTHDAATKFSTSEAPDQKPGTFLPRPEASQSAPAKSRLKYIHYLGSPPVWKLEAELAARWVSLGALRTALDIYERLGLWAEVALCYAATDQEVKAKVTIREQLYESLPVTPDHDSQDNVKSSLCSTEKRPLPADAPRLFCILGDLENSMSAYERAWQISNYRYARAQRSIAKLHVAKGNLKEADDAYERSLKLNPQNQATWFALGCLRLQLETWLAAVDAFSRAVQVDDADGESWSNLAVALLRVSEGLDNDDTKEGKEQRLKESFVALKRAAALKRDSFRIWQNLLAVGIKLDPPPYTDIVIAQTRIIDLLGSTDGENCVDAPIVEALLNDLIMITAGHTSDESENDTTNPKRGFEKMVTELIQKKIAPLITSSRRLWIVLAKLSIHQKRPYAALTAYEKAWRSQLNQPSWDSAYASGSKPRWHQVVESTIDLMDAYESLGERTKETGLSEGEFVAKDWKFKARSAARSVLSRSKEAWEDDEAYKRLQERMQDFKAG